MTLAHALPTCSGKGAQMSNDITTHSTGAQYRRCNALCSLMAASETNHRRWMWLHMVQRNDGKFDSIAGMPGTGTPGEGAVCSFQTC